MWRPVALVIMLLAFVGVWGAPAHAATDGAVERRVGTGDVSCPAELDGVPLSTDEEFAGTPRALANDEGILVRFTLLCPYHRANGASVAELTLAWSRYQADDLECQDVELTSEPTGDGRVQGALDHRTLSAKVTYGAASEDLLPLIDDAATEMLANVPANAYPCEGGAGSGVDATLALPTAAEPSSSLPIVLAVAVVAGSAALIVIVTMLVRRSGRRRRRAAKPAPDPDFGDPAAAIKRRAANGATAAPLTPPDAHDLAALVAERDRWADVLRAAVMVERAIDDGLERVRQDLATHRAHAQAIRDLAASFRDGSNTEYIASYAGVMTLAVAATNLVSTGARRAVSLVASADDGVDAPVAAAAAHLDAVHRQITVAAEAALDDTRYWLWQARRLAVVEALTTLERLAPRQVALQQRLAVRVIELPGQVASARGDSVRARLAVEAIDRRLAEARERPRQESQKPLERTGA